MMRAISEYIFWIALIAIFIMIALFVGVSETKEADSLCDNLTSEYQLSEECQE